MHLKRSNVGWVKRSATQHFPARRGSWVALDLQLRCDLDLTQPTMEHARSAP